MIIDRPKIDFSSFSFSQIIMSAIDKAGYIDPTNIQSKAIPAIQEGRDVLARAETGSGKTAAFVLPLLSMLTNTNIYGNKDTHSRYDGNLRANSNCVQVLVLVPTRELAIQVREVFEQLSSEITPPIRCLSVYGGVKINPQMMALRGGADVLVSTPGRLLDLSDQNAIKFNETKTLVIDEVDRLMKGDFEEEITRIMKLLPSRRQNLMFTATFPDSIRKLVREVMDKPAIINIDDIAKESLIGQHVITVNHDKKNDLLAHLLNENDWKQVLIFCSAKRTCNNLIVKLEKRGIDATAMHGDKEQSARAAALRDFKAGKIRILVATDVAARGLDIEHLPCVINYDLPRSPNDYTHRIGRTGRAGETGTAISLISHHEYLHFDVIDKRNDLQLKREQIEGFEADEIAPPIPERSKPKKKARSKNKKQRLREQQDTETYDVEPEYQATEAPLENSLLEEPTVESEAKESAVESEVKEPAVESEAKEPAVEAEEKEPAVESNAKKPAVESEAAKESAVEAEAKEPAVESEAKESGVESEAKEPAIESDAKEPAVESDAKKSAIESDAKEPAVESDVKEATEKPKANVNAHIWGKK